MPKTPTTRERTQAPAVAPETDFPAGVINLLQGAQSTHVSLSSMADSKASILMGATFLVFGLAMGRISESGPTASLLLLAGFAVLATVFSVLAIRPQLMTPPKTVSPNTNLLFFGSFSGLPEEEYIDRMVAVLKSEETVFRAMARDIYQNGRVLQFKKFRYLSYAYTTFLIGLALTAAAFVIELLMSRT